VVSAWVVDVARSAGGRGVRDRVRWAAGPQI